MVDEVNTKFDWISQKHLTCKSKGKQEEQEFVKFSRDSYGILEQPLVNTSNNYAMHLE